MTLFDVLAFFLLLVGSAFFSGTETALTAVSEGRLLSLAEQGDRSGMLSAVQPDENSPWRLSLPSWLWHYW